VARHCGDRFTVQSAVAHLQDPERRVRRRGSVEMVQGVVRGTEVTVGGAGWVSSRKAWGTLAGGHIDQLLGPAHGPQPSRKATERALKRPCLRLKHHLTVGPPASQVESGFGSPRWSFEVWGKLRGSWATRRWQRLHVRTLNQRSQRVVCAFQTHHGMEDVRFESPEPHQIRIYVLSSQKVA
jgi:hypothetical protein